MSLTNQYSSIFATLPSAKPSGGLTLAIWNDSGFGVLYQDIDRGGARTSCCGR